MKLLKNKIAIFFIYFLILTNEISCIKKNQENKNIKHKKNVNEKLFNLKYFGKNSGKYTSCKISPKSFNDFKTKIFRVFDSFFTCPKDTIKDDPLFQKFEKSKQAFTNHLHKYVDADIKTQVLFSNGFIILKSLWLSKCKHSIKKEEAKHKDDRKYNFNDYLTSKINNQKNWEDWLDRYLGRFMLHLLIEKQKYVFSSKVNYKNSELKKIVLEGISLEKDLINNFLNLCKKYKDNYVKCFFGLNNKIIVINGKKNYFVPMIQNFTNKLTKIMNNFNEFRKFSIKLKTATDKYTKEDPEGEAFHGLFKHFRETNNFVFGRIDSCFNSVSPCKKLSLAAKVLKTLGIPFIYASLILKKKINKRKVDLVLNLLKIYIEMGLQLVKMFDKKCMQEVVNGFLK